jgi:hypothetical protein
MEKQYRTVVCTNGDYDDLPEIVEFDIDAATAHEIVKLSALVKANDLVAVQKSDRRARYYQYDPVENPEQAQEAGEDNEVRTSADCLNVNDEDFWFSAYLKHADIELLSERRCIAHLIGCFGISAEAAGSAGDAVEDVVRGYGKANAAGLATLMEVEDWQRIARQEIERRATGIVQVLENATLRGIAAGEIDMRAVCRQVLEEQGRALS